MSQISGLKRPKGKTEYLPNLDQLLSQCELNYWLAQRVWPNLFETRNALLNLQQKNGLSEAFELKEAFLAKNDAVCLIGKVTHFEKYTTTMDLTIQRPTDLRINNGSSGSATAKVGTEVAAKKSENLTKPIVLIVRLYHDAKMMEVMEGTGPGSLKAIYQNDNSLKQSDEKRQANRFIGECLRASLAKV